MTLKEDTKLYNWLLIANFFTKAIEEKIENKKLQFSGFVHTHDVLG